MAVQVSRKIPLKRVRNIGIIAHIDAGKTTVTERILHHSGKIHRVGEVHDGQFQDRMDARGTRARDHHHRGGHDANWKKDCEIHLIDTPGHVDFADRGGAQPARPRRGRRRCSVASPASSRNRRRSGGRRTSSASRASPSSTRWIGSVRTSLASSGAGPFQARRAGTARAAAARRGALLRGRGRPRRDEGHRLHRTTSGATWEVTDIPEEHAGARRRVSGEVARGGRRPGRRAHGHVPGGRGDRPRADPGRHPQGDPRTSR